MTLATLCAQMPRIDSDADLKRRAVELDSWLDTIARFLCWETGPKKH